MWYYVEGPQLLTGVECNGNFIWVCAVGDGDVSTVAKEQGVCIDWSTVEGSVIAGIIRIIPTVRHKYTIAESSITDGD